MDRRRMAAGVVGVVVVASVGGFVAGTRITSPAEIASRTAAPDASPIMVPVEERLLSTDVVTRGTGRFGSPQKLSVATSALKPNPGLVAELPIAGAQLVEGDVVANASGRPLFVFVGARPMSRDLGPGSSGDDVRQLEESLVRLGFDVGAVDGLYDVGTEAGVSEWYAAEGFAPFTATVEQLAEVRARAAESANASVDMFVAAAEVAATDATLVAVRSTAALAVTRAGRATAAVDRARSEGAAANVVSAAEVAGRQAALDAMRSGSAAPRATPAEVAAAEADLASARAGEASVRSAGVRAVADAQAALDRAPAMRDAAVAAAAAADTAAAADVAAWQAALDEAEADPSSTAAQLAVARADLASARAAAEQTRVTGVQAVADAQAMVDEAPLSLEAARSEAAATAAAAVADVAAKLAILNASMSSASITPNDIATAELELSLASANSESVRLAGVRSEEEAIAAADEAAADIGVADAAVQAAESALDNAALAVEARSTVAQLATQEADLTRLRAGVQVPADEVVFVATGPVRLSELLVGTGDPLVGGIMTVTDALVFVDGALAVEDAGLVQPGMTVQIDEPDLGIAVDGLVRSVAAGPGTNGVDGFHIHFEIQVDVPPANLVGASVRLTIPVESSGGIVLAVPVSALTLAPDGSSRVQRDSGDTTDFVTVEPGLSADGFVEVTAVAGVLEAGDLVVIGFDPLNTTSQVASPGPTDSTAPTDSAPTAPTDSATTDSTTGTSGA
jgi:multidrug efflux pump subunit AcrA (membrane-fusion protein)